MSPYPINSDVPARITRNYEKKELDTISSAAGVVKAAEWINELVGIFSSMSKDLYGEEVKKVFMTECVILKRLLDQRVNLHTEKYIKKMKEVSSILKKFNNLECCRYFDDLYHMIPPVKPAFELKSHRLPSPKMLHYCLCLLLWSHQLCGRLISLCQDAAFFMKDKIHSGQQISQCLTFYAIAARVLTFAEYHQNIFRTNYPQLRNLLRGVTVEGKQVVQDLPLQITIETKAERELTENELEAIKFVKNSEKSFLSISSSVDQTNENASKKRKKSKKNKPKSAIDVFMKSSKQKENSPNGQPGKEVESFVGIVDTPDAQQCNQVDEDVGQVVSRFEETKIIEKDVNCIKLSKEGYNNIKTESKNIKKSKKSKTSVDVLIKSLKHKGSHKKLTDENVQAMVHGTSETNKLDIINEDSLQIVSRKSEFNNGKRRLDDCLKLVNRKESFKNTMEAMKKPKLMMNELLKGSKNRSKNKN